MTAFEPHVRLPLAGGTHDRAAHVRSNAVALAEAWAHPEARVLRVHQTATALPADRSDLAYLTVDRLQNR